MKVLSKIFLLLLSLQAFCQKTDAITVDSTGNVYVIFLKNDSTGVVYKGKHTTFTTDYVFAKDLTAFDLQFKGFSRFKIKATDHVHDCIVDAPKDTAIILPPTIPPGEVDIFPNPPNYQKNTYFVEPYTWDKAKHDKPKIVGMSGFDFAPMAANQKSLYEYGEWVQEYHSRKGHDVWSDNGTYFLKPKGYFTDLSTNLMDFDLRFPDFTTPKGKIVVMQPTPTREIDTYNYLKKGVSYAKGRMDQKGYSFVSDGWLIELGCPPAYDSRPDAKEIFDKWCNDVDGDKLLQSFISNVYYPNKDVGYVMLNWEHVGHRWNVRKDKIIRCLEYWKNSPHTAKMALWTVSSVSMGKPIFQGYGIDFSEILAFNGSIEQLRRKYGSYVSTDDTYAKYVEIAQIGGYMNYPIDDGLIHHYLFELLLNKKYTDKQVLWTFWVDQEFIDNFDLGWVRVNSKDGSYLAQVKPKVFPSVAFNVGVWSIVGDGFDCWSEPNYWTNKKEFWGWGSKDLNGNELPNKFDEYGSKYPSQPMKPVDWMMSGVWAMSENKDIIEAKTDWQFVTLPTKSYHEKSVLVAYKAKGNEALVLAYDGFCDADAKKQHLFSINNKNYSVKTYGRYTSVVRLKL